MPSETDDANGEPEAIETLDKQSRAWYHNKLLVVVVFGVLSGGMFILTVVSLQEEPETPVSDVPESIVQPAPVVASDAPSNNLIPAEQRDALSSSISLAEDVWTPTPTEEPIPEEKPEEADTLADLVDDGTLNNTPAEDDGSTLPGIMPTSRTISGNGGGSTLLNEQLDAHQQRIAQRRTDSEFDAVTAPSVSTSAAWGGYWSEVQRFRTENEVATEVALAALPPPEPPSKGRTLLQGVIVKAVVERATRSDGAELPLTAIVVRDVLDSVDGRVVAIPKGSKIVGAQAGITWNRIKGFWRVVQFPNGETVNFNAALAAADGSGGMQGTLHTGVWRRLGIGFAAATISAGANLAADEPEFVRVPLGEVPSVVTPAAVDGPPGPDDADDSLPTTSQSPPLDRVIPVESPKARAARELSREIADLTRAEVEMMADRHIPYVDVSGGKTVFAVLTEDLRF